MLTQIQPERADHEQRWQEQEQDRRDWMAENSLYREEDEHSSCGVGLVVNIDGKPAARSCKRASMR